MMNVKHLISLSLFGILLILSGCKKPLPGCTDPSAANYDPEAGIDDGTCQFAVPERYYFERRDIPTLNYNKEVVRQLLINDLDLLVGSLGEAGASPVTQGELLAYYDHMDAFNLVIATPVGSGYTPADSTFSSLARDTRLSDKVVDLPPVDMASEEVLEWTGMIAAQSQTVLLGSPEVWTSPEGLDLREMLRITLLGSVLYGQATDSLLLWVDTLDNITFRSGCSCTDLENTLDRAFGNWGAAQDYRAFSDEDLAGGADAMGNLPYVRDADNDGQIDFLSEYNHSFSRLAGQRDLGVEGSTRFTEEIFDAFLEARAAAAVGPGQEAAIRLQADLILMGWDRLIAATVVHHINEVLTLMSQIGSPDYDLARHNRAWADMYAFTQMLGYNSLNQAGSPETLKADYLDPMGSAPLYDAPGTPDHEGYLLVLEILRSKLGNLYGFTQEQLEKW